MPDPLSQRERSTLMSKVRDSDTKPEWIIRCALHRLGFRYTLKNTHLPGRPDLALPKYRAAIFVHGCFWHRHPHCRDASTPKRNRRFWTRKFAQNVERDAQSIQRLTHEGWRVLVVWECDLTKNTIQTVQRVAQEICSGRPRKCRVKYPTSDLNREALLAVAEKRVRHRISVYGRSENDSHRKRLAEKPTESSRYSVVDLFSGAGGMSYGFAKHYGFYILAAADAEIGKPSAGSGRLQCNTTYSLNLRVTPSRVDLGRTSPTQLRAALGIADGQQVDVLTTCPPCTGFSRANPQNHLRDDSRNSLVHRSAEYAVALDARVVVMENAREFIRGNFRHHYESFRTYLEKHGYNVFGRTYFLSRFGLPQIRERAVVIAAKTELPLHTLESLWDGWRVREQALTVRRAFDSIEPNSSGADVWPAFASHAVRQRIVAIPKNGGSWVNLLKRKDAHTLLTDAMKRIARSGRFGSYPDVYGRMSWDKPAPTIKRECSHVGNGRYSHPEEDRLCSLREMAVLQGFPNDFAFHGSAVSNMYRHIGDAVPPLISYQLAHLCMWMLTGQQPQVADVLLPGTNLRRSDVVLTEQQDLLYDSRGAQ